MDNNESRFNALLYEYYRLSTSSDGGLTPELVERFAEAVEDVIGPTAGLGMAMIAEMRSMLRWQQEKKA
jgi:hypothetical protein